jgi:hypothetical protein
LNYETEIRTLTRDGTAPKTAAYTNSKFRRLSKGTKGKRKGKNNF